ncbi:MAG: sodium:solute symporter family protein [Ignavibacteriaceae bacterium]
MTTQSAILIALIIYACLMLSVSIYWMKKVKIATDYLLGGRELSFWILTGTITATGIGTGVIIGGSGLAYQHGWAGCAYPIGLGLGTILTGLIFAKMRRYKFMTIVEEVSAYYAGNRAVVEFSYIVMFVSNLCWLTVQIMGGAAVLSAVTDLPISICTVVSGFITAMISIPGGLKSVVYTDFLQAIILLCGFGFLTQTILSNTGGIAGLRNAVPNEYFSFLGVSSLGMWAVISLIITLVLSVISDPTRRQTMFSASSVNSAKKSMIIAGTLEVVFSVVIGIVGMYAYKLNMHLSSPDQSVPWLIANVLPPWIAAVVVVSIASGIFSAANGAAISTGTFFVRHIYPLMTGRYAKKPLVAIRRTLALAFVISTAIALRAGSIVGFIIKFLPLTISGLSIIILFGRFWKRGTWQGALAALIATPIVSLVIMFLPKQADFWKNPIIPATIVGAAIYIIISLLTPPNKLSFEDIVERLNFERHAIEGTDKQPENTQSEKIICER